MSAVPALSPGEAVLAPARATTRGFALAAILIVAPVALWFIPLGVDAKVQHAIAISAFMILSWITHALDHALTGLIGCFLFWALGVAKFEVAFSGFATTTPWFLFGAILFGMMAAKTGLARRIAYVLMRRIGNTYSRLLLGLIVSDFVLTFIAPSGIARVVIMATIALGLIEAFGLGPSSNVARGMFLILTYTAGLFDKMVIAGAASITARGLIESVGGVEVLWSRWLLAYLPCTVITILVAWQLTLRMFRPEKPALPGGARFLNDELRRMGPWTRMEKQAALLMLLAIALWMTDFWHHISPAMVGLGIGLVAVLPVVGVLNIDDMKKLNYLPVFFVAAAVCMGNVLIATKSLDLLTNAMMGWMEGFMSNPVIRSQALYWTAFGYHVFLGDEISMLSTSIPVLMKFAHTHGLDPLSTGMVWTFAAGGKIFIYQSAVMVVGYSYGCFSARDFFRMGLYLTVVQALLLLLIVPFYWPLIGIGR
jgi:solute carrier family 13 (sodium-dependent dicarboxylate transporter), member 2/3/5